jgi:metal-responsive CopG/Arc/MetJ family transcriptional regulator
MKTAISIPDSVFEAAERLAARRKMSRSELYSLAVADWVERHRDDRVTEALDALYGVDSPTSTLDADLHALQLHTLRKQRR